ncbi:hypothetical protein [Sphingomonas sp. Root241]|uniref:hypothetical protein n=1 Tax=Sphingomonas sp. Root241 TaxID=1736501 RepID=UPI0006F3BD0F|nr:hypothetical protein [Sphingomonas sp. Root241]KRC81645.1 hypothetical protein ASE13_04500 [Sphingomonas sp. Root241]
MNANHGAEAIDFARRIASAELSLQSRIAHGALLAAALAMTMVIVALLLTEPGLPLRTLAALAVLAMIGATWTGYAAWVLTQRRVLFARQRVVAGWLALIFTSVFTAGAFAIGAAADVPTGFAAGGLGLALVAGSGLLLARARQRLAVLLDRRRALEALGAGAAR